MNSNTKNNIDNENKNENEIKNDNKNENAKDSTANYNSSCLACKIIIAIGKTNPDTVRAVLSRCELENSLIDLISSILIKRSANIKLNKNILSILMNPFMFFRRDSDSELLSELNSCFIFDEIFLFNFILADLLIRIEEMRSIKLFSNSHLLKTALTVSGFVLPIVIIILHARHDEL